MEDHARRAYAPLSEPQRFVLCRRAWSAPWISHRAGGNGLSRAQPNFCIDCVVAMPSSPFAKSLAIAQFARVSSQNTCGVGWPD
jgi:hypothetical protein